MTAKLRVSPEQSIGPYRITVKLDESGMVAVYRATDTRLNRDAAVKVLPEGFAQDAAHAAIRAPERARDCATRRRW